MEKYILLDTENNFEVIERPDEQRKLDFWYEHIGCQCIDIVDCVNNKYCLVVDDGGWLVGEPQVNSYASLMYGFLNTCHKGFDKIEETSSSSRGHR